jgi:TolB-like protein/tetratricopeptide (TPR) repeat protein
MSGMPFLEELKRRNVLRVAIAYLVVAWLVAQVLQLVFDSFGTPDWVMKTILVLMAAGLVFAAFFAWAFELTPEGIKRERDVDRARSNTNSTGRKLDFVIIAVLVTALGYFAVDKFVLAPKQGLAQVQPAAVTAEDPPAPTSVQKPSIAVLPFVNMSEDASNEYFSDGLSEEILNLLARIQGLKVIARTSSFAFKGRNEDLREIGKTLDVTHVLEGSVRKSGERLRITAQLIDVSDGSHLWSDTYDRTMTDVFAIQDEVSAAIVEALAVHVGRAPSRGRPTDNTEAYALYLRAKAFMASNANPQALDLLLESVALDPGFAEAHELIALSYWYLAGTTIKSDEGQRLTFAAAEKALALDPGLPLAKTLWVSANYQDYSYLAEIEAIERLIEEQPSNGYARDMLAFDLIESGYFEEATVHARHWLELDPLAIAAYVRVAESLSASGLGVEALAVLDSAASRLEEGTNNAPYVRAPLAWMSGDVELAITNFKLALYQFYGMADTSWVAEALQLGNDPQQGEAFLDQLITEKMAELPEDIRFDFWRTIANWYLLLGHIDRYYEIVNEIDLTTSVWTDADWLMYVGNVLGDTGFTAHPQYVELATALGIVNIWEQRGPPDHCQKVDNNWVCR